MHVSVLIPTFNRPAKAAACVSALAQQSLSPAEYEVLIGVDGPDTRTEEATRSAWKRPTNLTVLQLPKQGQASIRNQLLKQARGRTLVFLNDDMIPDRALLELHLRHQQSQEKSGRAALIVGDSPWSTHTPDSLFDRLIRETSMVFFYNVMKQAPDPNRDWGFRHAWLLNLSAPAALVREAGGFTIFPSTYGYEDDELAYRLAQRFKTPVLYRPDAIATHDHRITPTEYLKREYNLGFAAWGFARTTPECAHAMFNRDITSREELNYSRAFVERESKTVQRLEESFLNLAEIPATGLGGDHAPALLNIIYEQHLVLKRYHWRRGLLAAASQSSR